MKETNLSNTEINGKRHGVIIKAETILPRLAALAGHNPSCAQTQAELSQRSTTAARAFDALSAASHTTDVAEAVAVSARFVFDAVVDAAANLVDRHEGPKFDRTQGEALGLLARADWIASQPIPPSHVARAVFAAIAPAQADYVAALAARDAERAAKEQARLKWAQAIFDLEAAVATARGVLTALGGNPKMPRKKRSPKALAVVSSPAPSTLPAVG